MHLRAGARLAALLVLLLAPACRPVPPPPPISVPDAAVDPAAARQVLEGRCMVCHGCYDAPCQLVLTAHEGVARGATKEPVYQATRLREAPPTRLGIDATTTEGWREKGFFPVVPGGPGAASPGSDLLLRMLALGATHPLPAGERLPPEVELAIDRSLTCPAPDAFDAYAEAHPFGGMPYGTAPLARGELAALSRWAAAGAPAWPAAPPLSEALRREVARWEAFLNGPSPRERLVARYLYEHWFLSRLHFDAGREGPFFEIVRSAAPPGRPVEVIPTRRPTDDPGAAPFWYRLRRLDETVLHKTHILYALGGDRLERLRELFLAPGWQVETLPPYDRAHAANPFLTFGAIPARARYRFLLDDARHFVMTFIRGPVCRGQIAVNVIRDRFWVAFLDPDVDLSVTDPGFFERATPLLELPEESESNLALLRIWTRYDKWQEKYQELRERAYAEVDPERLGPTLDAIWDGDGHDRDALLTVFRHFDNAEVEHGFLGDVPQTAWVMDYPIFERIYYDLVAGFDVFGNLGHQVSTRLYMDHLRMQSEDLFLLFLPEPVREPLQRSWYEGAEAQLDAYRARGRGAGHGTRIPYGSEDPKAELLRRIEARHPEVAGPPDRLNRCAAPPCARPGASRLEQTAERALTSVAGVTGPWVRHLPELSLVRVRAEEGTEERIYTLLRDSAHSNVAFMFGEEDRRLPEHDTLTLLEGVHGSYPNFVFEVGEAEVLRFADTLRSMQDEADVHAVAARFGVRRTSPRFWETVDAVHEALRRQDALAAGLLDWNRYQDL